ncbi:MAG: tRNA preQ1(34) S-adenosylmethionine ribosyltransferase-isomerase QueA [Burkholderiaceae bacterium]|jgi:S-adenosylmethionine:tRNA ribosyltransferase-isomerase|nr:tRNA preQ1(34) S-adenosylmethionine ribosyltransferase-isomerase QueA [Burkholderiaceae bacterium]ODS98416.1 MAG: tRNA preQ1(34) S-adenosylmethionine ribosyltransferase-isomerase QueA [Lautropia sp. SCN 69-89]HMN65884.1 tRNA preQ1(34) S-adenosylmethionine ribosyltransferase-isomerase QueA [Burkholderiaceae bacterium]
MRLSDFDFELPAELIAQHPGPARSASRLLHVRRDGLSDLRFDALPGLLEPGELLVFNDTRVLRARLRGSKDTGGRIEALVERITSEHEALAQLRASKPPRPGTRLAFGSAHATVTGRAGEFWKLRFDDPVLAAIDREGELPLPPYITHAPDAEDERRYQTVYAREPGSVAAPTAGLHFDEPLLARLRERGVELAFVTLHVGAGTFQPVRVDDLSRHRMHAERFSVPAQTAEAVARARAAGRRVVAVGTTSLRTLESAASEDGRVLAGGGETRLFVTPGYAFRVVDRLITNFHLPKSTLLMLVSAFAGVERIRAAYAHAIAERYRFFSYGDAMLLEREQAAAPGGPAGQSARQSAGQGGGR